VAVLAVGVATLLSNHGLDPRVMQAAHARLQRTADHLAAAAGVLYSQDGRWTPQSGETLAHFAAVDDLRVRLVDGSGRVLLAGWQRRPAEVTTAPVLLAGLRVGTVSLAPVGGQLLTPEESHLRGSLDRLHLLAAGVSVVAALVLALLLAHGLAEPLRRLRLAAQRIERGELETRVAAGGGAELSAVAHAFNRLAETLQQEEGLRRASVADLAHELRTPVNGLLARIEAAQDGVLPPEENLEAMHAEALRLTRLLDDLARLADAEQPGLLVEKRPVALDELVLAEAGRWRPLLAEKGLELEVEVEPLVVAGDRDRLSQILANLLSNAERYTERGSVRVRLRREAGSAVVEVEDTGIGIAPDDLKHVFKRFWRGDRSRSRATGGAGIGLAIVRELVRAHDGRIDVESVPARGSTFRVYLPLAELHKNSRTSSQVLRGAPARS
ncbi:MAG TPA: ATP-binding protein, partial [Gaiellaceae bacterium]|nr:ATP-binding protein [Gaiellaceae bacterium]